MSFLSIPALLGPVIGPPLGGFMVTYMSWHWIFLINIPIGVLGIALVLRYVAEIREESAPGLDWLGFLLSAACLAMLVSGFEAIGRDIMPLPALLACSPPAPPAALRLARQARRASHHRPVADEDPHLRHLHAGRQPVPLHRGRHPFLLAMLLQVGFGLTPFSAGLITFASAAGALLMKFVATPIVRHFGFRRVLTVNAVLAGAFVAASAAFTPTTPVWLMIAVLLVGGFFRSLQFTGVNTLTYADIPPAKMSRASSFAAMAQQLGISLGVAAVTLNVSMTLRGAETLAIRDVVAGFIVIGLMCAASVFSFRRLEPLAGAHLNGAKQSDDE